MPEVYENIYLNEIPLPNNPLKSINNYIVKGDEFDLMVDTAFNLPLCVESMDRILEELDVDPRRLKLFLTHLHSDHSGLASALAERGATILMGEIDARLVSEMCEEDSVHWRKLIENAHLQGLDEDHLSIQDHPGFRFRPRSPIKAQITKEGDIIEVGEFRFEVIDLHGHTPGMQGLYEREKKILFCGDHILGKITPNITFWSFEVGDSLGTYFEHLEKVRALPIEHLFSAHRFLVEDVPARIDTLYAHHAERLKETVDCLRTHGPSTVRTVTRNLSWDIRSKSWEDFPKSQKWFASGEAMAHLEHLVAKGEVVRDLRHDGVLLYHLAKES